MPSIFLIEPWLINAFIHFSKTSIIITSCYYVMCQFAKYYHLYLYPNLFQNTFMKWMLLLVSKSCLILCDPMDCSSLGSSVHGILQARILEWGAISLSRTAYLVGDKSGKIRRSWPLKGQGECYPLGNGEWSVVLSVELTWSKETSSKLKWRCCVRIWQCKA